MVSHLDLAYVHGRFNEFSGSFTIDKADPGKSSVAMSTKWFALPPKIALTGSCSCARVHEFHGATSGVSAIA